MRFRHHLVLLVLAVLAPTLALMTVATVLLVNQERAATERGLLETARALTLAIDHEIAATFDGLQVLAISEPLERSDFAGFMDQARRALATHPQWQMVFVADAHGNQLANTASSNGTALPPVGGQAYFSAAIEGGRPVVSPVLVTEQVSRRPSLPVAVPIRIGGTVRYVLVAPFVVGSLSRLFDEQRVPRDWIGAVLDRDGRIIGRSRDPDRYFGKEETADLARRIRAEPIGLINGMTIDGQPSIGAFVRSPATGWTVLLGMPAAIATDSLYRWLLVVFGGGGAILAVGVGAATLHGRRIARSLLSLVEPARALARGEVVTMPSPRLVTEVGELATEIDSAAMLLRQRDQERQIAEHAETDQRRRLQGVLDNTVDGIITLSEIGGIESVNAAAERMFGYAENEIAGRNIGMLMPEPFRSQHREFVSAHLRAGQSRDIGVGREILGLRRDGTTFPMQLGLAEIPLQRQRIFVASVNDLTARKEAEQILVRAQKMDAVGQLTGGIAHDFNNLLTVIIGNAEHMTTGLELPEATRSSAQSILSAAEKGASLTSRLLAFARRQLLSPVRVDVNELVRGMGDLLRRTLGEQIQVAHHLARDAWPATADFAQLESALLNLAINARDAMPAGGKLTIETANVELDAAYAAANPEVEPGPYLMLAVSDTGTGMTADTLDRVFEPFFTTKEMGRGSGLGLSMVYGFIKQSGGHIKIYSEIAHGTSVKMYLPRAEGPSEVAKPSDIAAPPPRGTETVLVVEDNAMVRATVTSQLEGLGYTVLAAESGDAALAILAERGPVDLLFTDIVMPGRMSGLELAGLVAERYPDMRVMFTSGYTEQSVTLSADLRRDAELLPKPYRQVDLARKIRKVLDRA
jgi:PAS domain S-box-containing protein